MLENQQLTLLSQRVRLDVHVEDVTLVADRGKIRLILENLVSNAVKYSPKGGTIHLMARTTGAQLVLDVADGGPGIPVEDREHIFDAFYTGRAARSTAVKGTGIGLSVVLEFVSAHGGTVQIVDGAVPRCALPHHHAHPREHRGPPAERAQGAGPCGLAAPGPPAGGTRRGPAARGLHRAHVRAANARPAGAGESGGDQLDGVGRLP